MKAERAGSAGKAGKNVKAGRTGRAEKAGKVVRAEKIGKAGRTGRDRLWVEYFSGFGTVIRCLYFGDCSLILRFS